MESLPLIGEAAIITGGASPTQNEVNSRMAAYASYSGLICIDVESWEANTAQYVADNSTIPTAVAKYADLTAKLRIACPYATFGHFEIGVRNEYTNVLSATNSANYLNWQSANTAYGSIGSFVDCVFPCLYEFNTTLADWLTIAGRIQSEIARTLPGKKVYPFLWPLYYAVTSAGNGPIDGVTWRSMLDFCTSNFDGVVLWSGSLSGNWDRTFPWWCKTQEWIGPLPVDYR